MHKLIVLASAALICSGAAFAQGSSSSGSSGSGGTSSAAGSGTGGSSSQAGGGGSSSSSTGTLGAKSSSSGASGSNAGSSISRADSKMIADLAEANIAEIQAGKLALQKAQGEPAKSFAQKMIDDHTQALTQVQTLAQSKGVKVPEGADMRHKVREKMLQALSGSTFDSQYLKRAGVNDHQRTIELLQKAQKQAKDPDLKAMAAQMLPTVQQHLQMAQSSQNAQQASTMGSSGSSGYGGSTSSGGSKK